MDSGGTTYLFLAGGALRDLLLGGLPMDLDFAFSGSVRNFEARFPAARRVGRSVDVWILSGHEFRPLHENSIKADLLNRDFTINALLMAEDGRLYAHPGAIHDLTARILRPASDSAFFTDPARLFRLGRLAASLPDFQVHQDNWRYLANQEIKAALAGLPAERVGREMQKTLSAPKPSRFLDVLDQADKFLPWFIELEGASAIPAGPPAYHDGSVLAHTGQVMDKCASDPLAVWMALCHDLGKVRTAPALWPRHFGHDKDGESPANSLGLRLRLPGKFVRAGALAARLHMRAALYDRLRPATRTDLLLELDRALIFQAFWTMVKADSGQDFLPAALADLARIKSVRLPSEKENQGAKSGQMLRQMRIAALASGKNQAKRS